MRTKPTKKRRGARRRARAELSRAQGTVTSSAYSYRRKSKADWAGVSLGSAFNASCDYYERLPARALFYRFTRESQMAVTEYAGVSVGPGFEPATKPQLSPAYTGYPSALAALAAIGQSAFLEFEARVPERILFTRMDGYLADPTRHDEVDSDPEVYQRLARAVTRSVQSRLLLEDLSRARRLTSIEMYRLFLASQLTMRFRSLPEIVESVVLYSDVLPSWEEFELHRTTRKLLQEVADVSERYLGLLSGTESERLLDLGIGWVRDVCKAIAPYLPGDEEKEDALSRNGSGHQLLFGQDEAALDGEEKIPPLDGLGPPMLFEPESLADQVVEQLGQIAGNPFAAFRESSIGPLLLSDVGDTTTAILRRFASAVCRASGRASEWEDIRSDLVEAILRSSAFSEGPLQGAAASGHEVTVPLGDNEPMSGALFEEVIQPSDDSAEYERLMQEAKPIAEALRRQLYPNVEDTAQVERARTSGTLDAGRLALGDVSDAVFRRYSFEQRASRRGRPVLLLVCDGSGSLRESQMATLKALSAAWLTSTARTRIQVLAGLYHSGVFHGASHPTVEWIYHPRKSLVSRSEAVRSVAALPKRGSGNQADALSLAFMLEEARQLAQDRMVYLILISDTEWIRSFSGNRTAAQEMFDFFQTAYDGSDGKLHTTLVALDVDGKTGLEELLDKVITVPEAELTDYAAVAEKISLYVASLMVERRRTEAKGR